MRTKSDIGKLHSSDSASVKAGEYNPFKGFNPRILLDQGMYKRWNPNGITDNTGAWKLQRTLNSIINEAKEQRIADSHDITKSTMGFI